MDLGLLQNQVAERIGVDRTTYRNWEKNQTTPRTRYLTAIIDFLEYVPYTVPSDFPEWLRLCRTSLGLTQLQLAEALGMDESTVNGWEQGRHQPSKASSQKLRRLLPI